MNKAFMREPEEPDDMKCPSCGALGQVVSRATLEAQLPPSAFAGLAASVWFCPGRNCDVGYFDQHGQTAPADLVRHQLYPKWEEAPLCPCFGVMAEEIETDARAGKPERVRELIARSKSPAARCGQLAANGQCCVAEAQKLYLRVAVKKR